MSLRPRLKTVPLTLETGTVPSVPSSSPTRPFFSVTDRELEGLTKSRTEYVSPNREGIWGTKNKEVGNETRGGES